MPLTRDGVDLPYRLDDGPVLEHGLALALDGIGPPRLLVAGDGDGARRAAHALSVLAPERVDRLDAPLEALADRAAAALSRDERVAAVIVPLDLGVDARALEALEAMAGLGEALGVPFVAGASEALAGALRDEAPGGPAALRSRAGRFVCLVPSSGAAGLPAAVALGQRLAAARDPALANVIGLDTGGAIEPGAAVHVAASRSEWRALAEAGLAAPLRHPDGRAYFPGAPTLARPPEVRDWSDGADGWARRKPWTSPGALGRQLGTQLPWVLVVGAFVRAARAAWRALGEDASHGAFLASFVPAFGAQLATDGAPLSPAVRRRRPLTTASRVSFSGDDEARQVDLLLCFPALDDRPALALAASGRLGAAEARARPRTEPPGVPPELEELFAAVYREPDDDAVRLVLGDRLLELGDPRGELITLQFRRRDGRATDAERARERALLEAHELAWLGPLERIVAGGRVDHWGSHPRWSPRGVGPAVTFERGFPERLALAGPRWLHEVLDARAWSTLRALALEPRWAPADALTLLAQPSLQGLRELAGVTGPVLSKLPGLAPPRLERLALHHPPERDVRALRGRLDALGVLRALEVVTDDERVASALDRLAPASARELALHGPTTLLSSAWAAAERAGVARFVFEERGPLGEGFALAFERAGAALTVVRCPEGREAALAQALDALSPGGLRAIPPAGAGEELARALGRFTG